MPKFAGVTSWEQYRQVFDAIAQSNGWGDATAALQVLSHLEGRGPSGTGGEANHVNRTGRGADRTLWVTGLAGGLSTSV